MHRQDVIDGLKYIANSPSEKGGFHPETIKIAKAALEIIEPQEASTSSRFIKLPQIEELYQAVENVARFSLSYRESKIVTAIYSYLSHQQT